MISTEKDGIKACLLAGDNVALTVADVQRVRTAQIGRSSLEICWFRLLFSKALAGRLSGTDRLDVPVKAVPSKNELDIRPLIKHRIFAPYDHAHNARIDDDRYAQRSMAETVNSTVKRSLGYTVRARTWYREFREIALICVVYNI
ncbi:hypothetical protein BDK88_3877 [Natrinema hispanicum]|uniref:Transposase IS4-like domain-containing protein n=1 Tax=Natrinema hispanicum TaxID=392421 RepID=A0A482Y8X1_9EURY|nr:hypothetical protein BDK88_3877 [Natrinema hispanicum]